MMHQRHLALNIGPAYKRTVKSETKNDSGKPKRKGSLRTKEKITIMVYKRCTLRIQANTKTILKRTLKLNESDRE